MKKTVSILLLVVMLISMLPINSIVLAAPLPMNFTVLSVPQENNTYINLYSSVQGETNASAAYRAFAVKAKEEGYPVIARLFSATADAEAKHAEDEWAILESMGATVRPVAEAPKVGTTEENLKAAFDGETYEYTVMYPSFLAEAEAEGMTAAARIFRLAMRAEEVHAGNYADVLANLNNLDYINSKYGVVYRCVICGEVVTDRPGRCPICGASGDTFVQYDETSYNDTYFNLYASVQGETNASAAYRAFAAKAKEEGYFVIARLFLATADAEAKHAEDEWEILKSMGATVRPVAEAPKVGTTAENLKAAFDGETYEYTVMYPSFLAEAEAEGMTAAARIFRLAMRAEEVHAGNYADVLDNLDDTNYIDSKYGVVYRCVICGEVVTGRPGRCPICGASGDTFVKYDETSFNDTYFNLYASVQGETNASAAYRAFAAKAKEEGYFVIARLFLATADAEAKHAEDEWEILKSMGATVRPVAEAPMVGTTAENLKAAFDGETYEYTVMYPSFLAKAEAEGMTAAARIFRLAMRAEEVHAGNYADVLANLNNSDYINSKYGVVYRCVICGEVVTDRPARCPICGASGDTFVQYGMICTVTFELNGGMRTGGGELIQEVLAGGAAEAPTVTRNGYLFRGWYTEADYKNAYDFKKPVTSTLTLYAKWIKDYYDDIDSNWAKDDILDMTEKGLFNGTANRKFEPDASLNRAMFITILWRVAGEPASNAKHNFVDVELEKWYASAVAWGVETGITKGISATKFSPYENITREMMTTMMYRYAQKFKLDVTAGGDLSKFTDASLVSSWAVDSMKWAVGHEIIRGKPNNMIYPSGLAARSEAATVISRFLPLT